ncbi:MAG: gliding motility-associated C-terminal domain-containing protein [Chitinophagaceae bacterium]
MRRCLILTVMLIAAQLTGLHAQTTFDAPDTVCIRQPISLKPVDMSASSYYWSFCSGYLMNKPTGDFLGYTFGINNAADIEIGRNSDGKYYGFFINRTSPEFIRLDYGNSLANIPTTTSLGNLGGTIAADANSLFLMQDGVGNFVMFVVGGASVGNSSLSRLDFGKSLSNKPNCVNMGNLGGLLDGPRGFFAAQEGPYWFGFAANALNGKLIRFDFGTNISNTPNVVDLGNPSASMVDPSDMAATKDIAGNWHVFVTNFVSNFVSHISFGSSLASIPTGTILPLATPLSNPSSIILAKDCGMDYAFISNVSKNSIVRIAFSDLALPTYTDASLDLIPGLKNSVAMSHIIREKDNLYSYVVNADGSLGKIQFDNCTSSTVRASTFKIPPTYSYDNPGRYNVFLSTNEGMPNASMECHLIDALPIPSITIVDDTLVCQGDTATLYGIAFGTDTLRWAPNYNITETETDVDALFTRVAPDYSRPYHFIAIYPNGCIVDSPIMVNVSKVQADAGVDRSIGDGSTTVMGGPMTTEGATYRYEWTPANFLSDPLAPNPTSTPLYDISYTLKVTSQVLGCVDYDTVEVKVTCSSGKLNIPNAFTPEDHTNNNDYFGIANRLTIVQLNYFRIFDRWGQEVFSTTDVSAKWNGQFEGIDCPYGVYVWQVDGFCGSGGRISETGNVTLIR